MIIDLSYQWFRIKQKYRESENEDVIVYTHLPYPWLLMFVDFSLLGPNIAFSMLQPSVTFSIVEPN